MYWKVVKQSHISVQGHMKIINVTLVATYISFETLMKLTFSISYRFKKSSLFLLTKCKKILMSHSAPHKFRTNQMLSRMRMFLPLTPPPTEKEVANDDSLL